MFFDFYVQKTNTLGSQLTGFLPLIPHHGGHSSSPHGWVYDVLAKGNPPAFFFSERHWNGASFSSGYGEFAVAC